MLAAQTIIPDDEAFAPESDAFAHIAERMDQAARDDEFREKLYACRHDTKAGRALTPEERLQNRYALIAEVCSGGTIDYDPMDVEAWFTRAANFPGVESAPRVPSKGIERLRDCEEVPNAPFREAYEARARRGQGEALLIRMAAALGRPGETLYVRKTLGIEPNSGSLRIFIDYDQGVALAHVLDLAPYECGV